MLSPNLIDSAAAVREEDLKIPTLIVLAKAHQAKMAGVTVNELADALESINHLSAADMAVTASDRVSRFRRQVFNLISHGTLQNEGLVMTKTPLRGQIGQRLAITAAGRAQLAKVAINGIGMPRTARPPLSDTHRTLEKAIARPALFVLATLEMDMKRPVPMSVLRTSLKSVLPASEADKVVLKNRKDTKMDQVIRNLISNKTLQNEKWVKHTAEGLSVTNSGYTELLEQIIGSLPTPPAFIRAKAPPEIASSLAQAVSESVVEAAQATTRPRARPR